MAVRIAVVHRGTNTAVPVLRQAGVLHDPVRTGICLDPPAALMKEHRAFGPIPPVEVGLAPVPVASVPTMARCSTAVIAENEEHRQTASRSIQRCWDVCGRSRIVTGNVGAGTAKSRDTLPDGGHTGHALTHNALVNVLVKSHRTVIGLPDDGRNNKKTNNQFPSHAAHRRVSGRKTMTTTTKTTTATTVARVRIASTSSWMTTMLTIWRTVSTTAATTIVPLVTKGPCGTLPPTRKASGTTTPLLPLTPSHRVNSMQHLCMPIKPTPSMATPTPSERTFHPVDRKSPDRTEPPWPTS